ncbi:MAG TPA: helix-turn-helix transcriptional regulator [Fastidiosipila sp.]|nr:helix-turn-helix transcriptional regulator [Fastidiosipila sp.]
MSYIRYLRKKNHLTQSQLADILGVTQTSVSQWESGRNFPDIKTARRLADYFDTTLDLIMSHSSDMDPSLKAKDALYAGKDSGGVALQDVLSLEIKRKILRILEQLSLTAKVRILERAEAYLEIETIEASADSPVEAAYFAEETDQEETVSEE